MGSGSTHQRGKFGLAGPTCFVMGLVLADRVEQELPFDDVRVRVRAAELPGHVLFDHVLAVIDSRLRVAQAGHQHGRALRAVGVVGIGAPAARHMTREREELGAVGECVLDRVVVEQVARLLVTSPAETLSRDGPGPLGPTGHVDVVAMPIDKEARRDPIEAGGMLDLEGQLVVVLSTAGAMHRAVNAIDSQRMQVADRSVVDPLDHLFSGRGMAPHEADAHLQALLLGSLGRQHKPARVG